MYRSPRAGTTHPLQALSMRLFHWAAWPNTNDRLHWMLTDLRLPCASESRLASVAFGRAPAASTRKHHESRWPLACQPYQSCSCWNPCHSHFVSTRRLQVRVRGKGPPRESLHWLSLNRCYLASLSRGRTRTPACQPGPNYSSWSPCRTSFLSTRRLHARDTNSGFVMPRLQRVLL